MNKSMEEKEKKKKHKKKQEKENLSGSSSDVSRNRREDCLDENKGTAADINKKHTVTPLGKKCKSIKHNKQGDVHSRSPETPQDIEDFIRNYRRPPSPVLPSDYAPGEAPLIGWDDSASRFSKGKDGKEWDISPQQFAANLKKINKALKNDPVFLSKAPSLLSSPESKSPEICEELTASYSDFEKKAPKPKPKPVTNVAKQVSLKYCEDLLKQLDVMADSVLLGQDYKKKSSHKERDNSFEELWGEDDPAFLAKASQLSQEVESKLHGASEENRSSCASDTAFSGASATSKDRCLSLQTKSVFMKVAGPQQHSKQNCAYKCLTKGDSSCCKHRDPHGNMISNYKENCSGIAQRSQNPQSASNILDKGQKKKYTFTKKFHSDSSLLPNDRQFRDSGEGASNDSSKKSNRNVENLHSSTSNKEENPSDLDSFFDNLDDDILSQPEVLSLLDKAESEACSERKCSQEEIEKKKAAAIKRRQERQLMRSNK